MKLSKAEWLGLLTEIVGVSAFLLFIFAITFLYTR